MSEYLFYYDETQHSREIGYKTVIADNYYDNFLSVIVGWNFDFEPVIEARYVAFEEKYAERKKKGELKSDTFKVNQFEYGFASFNKPNIKMMNDFLSIIDDNVYIYICVASKIEFVVLQLLRDYHNNIMVDMDAIKYSIVKALLTYRPQRVFHCIYNNPDQLIEELKIFFKARIEHNKKNQSLKVFENEAFGNILLILDDVEPLNTINWDYHMAFVGFDCFTKSKQINDYILTIDKEGEEREKSKTLTAAIEVGIQKCTETNSQLHFGLRIADMLAGIIGKMMKSLYNSLHTEEDNNNVTKSLLDKRWFQLNEEQLQLYKKLYHIVFEINNDWYKIYAGNYSDDLISFLALLEYMNHFKNIDQINDTLEMQPEYCNTYMCQRLNTYFQKMSIKIPIEPVFPETKGYFRNQRGAKVYFDIDKQPLLPLKNGENRYYVLSVGNVENGCPVVTVEGDIENMCYRLPCELSDWALTVTGLSMMGEKIFPTDVIFTKEKDEVKVDVLGERS